MSDLEKDHLQHEEEPKEEKFDDTELDKELEDVSGGQQEVGEESSTNNNCLC